MSTTTLPRVVIAAPASGSGKTTVSMGLVASLKERGMTVAPYKVGPDYIDPAFHSVAAGRVSRNLDSWLTGKDGVKESFTRGAADADIAVIEGVMGLFDGRGANMMDGSTAEIASLLGSPVLLVLDSKGMSGSAAALVNGFASMRPDVRVAGVILNNVASENHGKVITEAIESETGIPVLGRLPRTEGIRLPERHLGLVPAQESESTKEVIAQAGKMIDRHVDVDRIIEIANSRGNEPVVSDESSHTARFDVRIAVARDDAFSFYYEEGLDVLKELGAQLIDFSPLDDPHLPEVDGIILGGGFPEVFAARLSGNKTMRKDLLKHVQGGGAVFAECGGLTYLCDSLTDLEGVSHGMVGAIPANAVMGKKRAGLGYKALTTGTDSPVGPSGTELRAHEFHWSSLHPLEDSMFIAGGPTHNGIDWEDAFEVVSSAGSSSIDGLVGRVGDNPPNVIASYMHIHFGGSKAAAQSFLEASS